MPPSPSLRSSGGGTRRNRYTNSHSDWYKERGQVTTLFDEPNDLLAPLEGRGQEEAIARIFVRAMLHVRQNVISDRQIVLSVMDYTVGPGVPFFAYAELFNDAEALSRLRAGLYPGAHWDYLDLERSRVPDVADGGPAGGA